MPMTAETAETYDLLVVGGGPAGLAAAAEAAGMGASVGLVDATAQRGAYHLKRRLPSMLRG